MTLPPEHKLDKQHPHREDFYYFFKRAQNTVIYTTFKENSDGGVGGERHLDVTGTGTQVCSTNKGYYRKLAKHSFTFWLRFLAGHI